MVTGNKKALSLGTVTRETRIANHLHTPIPKRLYTLKEAACYLGRGLYGVREMVWRGEIPIVRSGRKMFVDIMDLENYVTRNKTTYTN